MATSARTITSYFPRLDWPGCFAMSARHGKLYIRFAGRGRLLERRERSSVAGAAASSSADPAADSAAGPAEYRRSISLSIA